MREQRITIRLGAGLGDPDAEVALRTALSIVQLLEAIDKKSWAVGHPRYGWGIAKASKSSPMEVECVAKIRIHEATKPDVVGKFLKGLRAVELRDSKGASLFGRDEFRKIAHIGNGKKDREIPTQIIIPTEDGKGVETFVASKALRHNAKLMDLQAVEFAPPTKEYAVLEGYLRTIRVDERPQMKFLHALEVIERDSQDSIWCDFKPGDEVALGAHAGGRVVVEGELTTDADGRKHMFVSAFRLIPKIALSVDDLRKKGLRLPDDMEDSVDYVKKMRAENG